jgi:MFS family permease
MAIKLYQSANQELNSDTVGMGLESMEIWKHQNYLLSGYHVTAADMFFFTELLPFQLIPQILTNYDPLTLKLVSYVIFALAVLVLALIVFFVSGSHISALVFAALVANLPAQGYWALAMPTTHNATIFFGGLILLLLLIVNRKQERLSTNGEKRKKKAAPAMVPWPYFAVLGILVFLTVFSDTIVVVWFLIPFVLAYMLFYGMKNRATNLAIALMAVLSIIAYVIKTYLISAWIDLGSGTRSLSDIVAVNLPLFFAIQAQFLNEALYKAISGAGALASADFLSIAVFAAVLLYAGKEALKDRQNVFFYSVLLISIAVMFMAFMVSGYARDLGGARYLTFTALAVILFVSVSYNHKDRLFGALILVFLALSALACFTYVSTVHLQPNAQEYGLIDYLGSKGLNYGYSTYFSSNVVTYLSGEDVTVRSVRFYPDHIQPDWLLSCDRWYEYDPDQAFILMENGTLDEGSRSIPDSLGNKLNFSETLYYQKYDIYPFTTLKPQ